MRMNRLRFAFTAALVCSATRADKPAAWWNAGWRYRTTVQRLTPCHDSAARPVEAAVDFPLLLRKAGIEGQFDPASVRIVARDANGQAKETPFARRTEYDARCQRKQSYLAWLAKPRQGQQPIFDIYFDTVGRGVVPAEYADGDLPPENMIGNPSFEELTNGVPNGWLLTPISWGLIGFIWAYNLVWLVVIDAIKVALYHHYDTRDSEETEIARPLDPFGGRLGRLSKVR